MIEKKILEELAEFAAGISFEEIPKPVIQQANRCLLDFMGCYWGGLEAGQNQRLLTLALETNPKPEATLWGMGQKAGAAEVALAHGCIGHHLEYDDGISLAAHWGSETIPAILAMAEVAGRGGSDLLTSIVIAYEIGTRVSQAFSAELFGREIHFPCSMGIFGAVAGVGRITGLNAAQTANALGNACLTPMAPYIPALSGSPIKDAYAGWPNALGIIVTRLSQAGWGGPRDLLEGPGGMGKVLGWSGSTQDLRNRILNGIGSDFKIMKTYFKPFPCCRWLHAPIQAILDLNHETTWRADEITSLIVEGPKFLKLYDQKSGFDQEITARFSLPYVTAAAVLYGRMGLEEFDPSRRSDPTLRTMAHLVTVSTDAELERAFPNQFRTRVKIGLKDGKCLVKECCLPWGPENPPNEKELKEKFFYLASRSLHSSQVEQWLDLFAEGIETDKGLQKSFDLLRGRIHSHTPQNRV